MHERAKAGAHITKVRDTTRVLSERKRIARKARTIDADVRRVRGELALSLYWRFRVLPTSLVLQYILTCLAQANEQG